MLTASNVNAAGLICDIIGAMLIWKYALPALIDRSGDEYLISGVKDAAEIAKAKLYDRRGRFGVVLLVIGFALQFASDFVPRG
jgi:hypothetical protein